MDKDYKKLIKAHTKKLNSLHKLALQEIVAETDYFVAYLKFIRDKMILTEPLIIDGKENMKIATIATAVKEYKSYANCVSKYFKIENKILVPKIEGTKEEAMKQYQEEKAYHWNAFWMIVKDNIEDWGIANATI